MKTVIKYVQIILVVIALISGYIACWADTEIQSRLIATAAMSGITAAFLPVLFLPYLIED